MNDIFDEVFNFMDKEILKELFKNGQNYCTVENKCYENDKLVSDHKKTWKNNKLIEDICNIHFQVLISLVEMFICEYDVRFVSLWVSKQVQFP